MDEHTFKMLEVYTSLLALIKHQQTQIEQLHEKLAVSSENSSLAPSNDLKKRRKKKKIKPQSKTGKKQGAQPGHKGVNRAMASIEDIDHIVDCYYDSHCSCGHQLPFNETNYTRQQVYDLCKNNNTIMLTEYRLHKTICSRCHQRHKGSLPAHLDYSIIGNELKALISVMVGEFHLSKSKVVKFLDLIYNLKISIGTVSNTEARISQALESSYDDAADALKNEEVIHADETRHRENNETHWAWVGTNEQRQLW